MCTYVSQILFDWVYGDGKSSSVFYVIVVPVLNPFIYSLRNKDVKVALRKTLSRRF
jgi:olfactory receptor